MSWIDESLNNVILKKLQINKNTTTYPVFYRYWQTQLAERLMRLFIWKNTDPVPAKEIEQRLILQGWCPICKFKGTEELTAFYGSFYGPTKYLDEWNNITVHCPTWTGQFEVDVNASIIDNNSNRTRSYDLVDYYAKLLAHADTSIVSYLVKMRTSGGSPIVNTQKQKDAYNSYITDTYNGKFGTILDSSMLGIEFGGTNTFGSLDLNSLIETKERIYKSFLNDIGIRSSFTKRSNTVEAEVDADSRLLLLNLSDMLDSRKKGCEKVNEMFGTSWSVELNPEIDYTQEIDGYEEIETETEEKVEVNEDEKETE